MTISILRLNDEKAWDEFNQRSPEGSVFSESCFLKAYGDPFEFYSVEKSGHKLAQLALMRSPSESEIVSKDFLPHLGIQFEPRTGDLYHDQSIRFRVKELLVAELFSKFKNIHFYMSPTNLDMRAFQWHEYHSSRPELKYRVETRYTLYLDISGLRETEDPFASQLFKSFNPVRRNLIRKSLKEGFQTEVSRDLQILNDLHRHKDFFMNEHQVNCMLRISEQLLKLGRAKLFVTKDKNGNPAFAALYLLDSKRAYYLFGAGHPDFQGEGSGALIQWESFKSLSADGVNEMDLVGINSPSRGAFKTRFGGRIIPYFSVSR